MYRQAPAAADKSHPIAACRQCPVAIFADRRYSVGYASAPIRRSTVAAQLDMLAFFQNLGMPEMVVIGIVALLIFGRRLPEVGRSLGRGIVEFKKGLRETGEEINQIGSDSG